MGTFPGGGRRRSGGARPARRVLGACVLAAVLAGAPPAARAEWVEWLADGSLAVEYDDNVNQSPLGPREETDVIWRGLLSLGRVFQAGERTRIAATADLGGDLHARFEGLDELDLGGTLAVTHKLGLGRDVPWLRGHVSTRHRNFREDDRDSWATEVGLELGRRLTPRLDASLAWSFHYRDGRAGNPVPELPELSRDVWDQSGHLFGVQASYLLLPSTLLSAGVGWWDGDLESVCPPANVAAVLRANGADAVARDGVFGDDDRACVYRIDGDAITTFVAVNHALSRHLELDLRWRFRHGDARRFDYQSNRVTFTVTYRH